MSVSPEAMQESLSDILSGKEPDEPVAAIPEPKGEKDAAPPAAGKDAGKPPQETKDEPKAEKPETTEAPKQEPPAKTRPDVAAIIDERRKRQAIERELAELKAGKPAAKPSVFENEDEAIRSRITEETRTTREAIYHLSRELALTRHGDAYKEAEQSFLEAAETDPELYKGLMSAPNPGEYVYTHGTYYRELAPHGGDVMKYIEHKTTSLKGEVAERDTRIKSLESEIAQLKQQKADLESLPRSLNSKSSAAAPKAGEDDDEEITSIARFGSNRHR